MNQLEKLHQRPGDKPGQAATRAAEASGIPVRTWRDWRKGTHPPSARSQRKLEAAYVRQVTIPALKRAIKRKGAPNKVRVTGTIRWGTSPRKKYNATAHRTTTLEGLRAVMGAVIRAWVSAGPHAAADAFERGASDVYRVPPDEDNGGPGIQIEGNQVEIEFP
jgi:hypothetical protein